VSEEEEEEDDTVAVELVVDVGVVLNEEEVKRVVVEVAEDGSRVQWGCWLVPCVVVVDVGVAVVVSSSMRLVSACTTRFHSITSEMW
jgi:hypothetical protein